MGLKEAGSGLWLFKKRQLFRLKTAKTYILPTAFGYAFGVVAFILFVMAIGYANNLIYIFVFFLISITLTSMVMTNKNVSVVQMAGLRTESLFARESGVVYVVWSNPNGKAVWSLEAFIAGENICDFALSPARSMEVPLLWTPPSRGWVSVPVVTLQSSYPFGVVRSWKKFRGQSEVLIFPQRKGQRALPHNAMGANQPEQSGLFRNHRIYQNFDSPWRIDWRASARHQEMLLKTYEETEQGFLTLTWEQTASLESFEDRVSQLALWVDEAEKAGFAYSLHLGDMKTSVSRGAQHWRFCLERLALLTSVEVIS